MKQQKRNHGFTLVEIMIVVVIIGLLAAMAIPAFQKVRASSQQKAIVNNLRQLAGAAQQYYLEKGESTVAYSELVGTDKYIKTIQTVAGENYEALTFNQSDTQLTIEAPKLGGTTTIVTFSN
jgi:prepilin-type N-terminal cleavage/methylation domain